MFSIDRQMALLNQSPTTIENQPTITYPEVCRFGVRIGARTDSSSKSADSNADPMRF